MRTHPVSAQFLTTPLLAERAAVLPSPRDLLTVRGKAAYLQKLVKKRTRTLQAAGVLRSTQRGRGIDFAELRPYQAGDEVRHIDWRVTARLGAHTKVFQVDQMQPALIVLDLAPSMYFGSRRGFKSTLASYLAALFLWYAQLQNNQSELYIAHSKGFSHRTGLQGEALVIHACRYLAQISAENEPLGQERGSSHMLQALKQVLSQRLNPGSEIYLISDFLWMNPQAELLLARLGQQHTVKCCFIYDDLEKQLPAADLYWIADGDQQLQLNTADSRMQQAFFGRFQRHQQRLVELCRRYGIACARLTAQETCLQQLLHLLVTDHG